MDSKFWTDLIQPDISIVEKIVRPAIVYFFLIVGLRLAGKRELAQLNTFDLVVLLTLSNTVQNAIIGNDNSVLGGIIGASTLLVVNYLVVRFVFSHEKLEQLAEGQAEILIENGELKLDQLKKELITRSELEVAARKQGFDSLEEVDKAIMEPGGTISFMGKKPTTEALQYNELISRLDKIAKEIEALRATR
jgi:uncharacterized membrane protein YcaP (DUF421 family)